jgi:hypothetical protein
MCAKQCLIFFGVDDIRLVKVDSVGSRGLFTCFDGRASTTVTTS